MWTTGQVRVRVMPSRFCTFDTTSLPRSSTLRASARTITSYGPVTSSAAVTPLIWATSLATWAALPTSVWMRMYAWTTVGTSDPGRAGVPPQMARILVGSPQPRQTPDALRRAGRTAEPPCHDRTMARKRTKSGRDDPLAAYRRVRKPMPPPTRTDEDRRPEAPARVPPPEAREAAPQAASP